GHDLLLVGNLVGRLPRTFPPRFTAPARTVRLSERIRRVGRRVTVNSLGVIETSRCESVVGFVGRFGWLIALGRVARWVGCRWRRVVCWRRAFVIRFFRRWPLRWFGLLLRGSVDGRPTRRDWR